jgi:integrase
MELTLLSCLSNARLDPVAQDIPFELGKNGQHAGERAADGKRKQLLAAGYAAHSMRQMMKRRLDDAGLPHLFSPHSFRVTVVTDLLNQNVPLEDVQYRWFTNIFAGNTTRW